VHVASDTLVRYQPEWEGPLLGDKAPSVAFDNSKVKSVVGDFDCPIGPWEGMKALTEEFPPAAGEYDVVLDQLYDRIIAEQNALGR
jgi:hypothetical protein